MTERADFRRFARWCAGGGALGIAAFVRVLWTNGGWFAGSFFGGFYEVQAKAFRQFRWNVPEGSLGIEAFVINKKSYEYYGPWPALLRIPLTILFPHQNGKWTHTMMVAALIIAMVAATFLAFRIRTVVRGVDTPLTRTECVLGAVFVFALGAGSVFTFLGSQAWVYHEAEIWGASLALASYACLVEYIHAPSRRRLIGASLFAGLAILSRASVGFGPILALVLVAGAGLVPFARRLVGAPEHLGGWRQSLRASVAAGIPIATYMYVNYSKFQSLFVFPSDKQIFSSVGVYRKEMLAQNENSLFGFKFFRTAALQYFRPDALRFQSLMPYVNFPRTAPVQGKDVLFDTIEPTSSAPSSMPFLFLLAVAGFVCIAWWRRGRNSNGHVGVAMLRIPVLGAMAGAFTVVPYSYIAQRYMSDFIPPLVLCSLAGMYSIVHWVAARRAWRRIAFAFGAVCVALSVGVNSALAYAYHHETELNPEGMVSAYVERQYRLHESFPGGTAPYVHQGDSLPYPPLTRGSVYVIGDCQGVYWSQGNTWPPASKWYAIARTEGVGQYDLKLKFDDHSDLGRDEVSVEPLVVRGEPGRVQTMAAIVSRDRFAIAFKTEGHEDWPQPKETDERGFVVGPTLKYVPGKSYDVAITMDPNNGAVSVIFSGFIAYAFNDFRLTTPQLASYVFPTDKVSIGANTVNDDTIERFRGTLKKRNLKPPQICDYLDLPRESR